MKRKKELTTTGAVLSALGIMVYVASFLSFMAIVSSWIPPVAGIVMELSVILFVIAGALVLSTVTTVITLFITAFLVGYIEQIVAEVKREHELKAAKEE